MKEADITKVLVTGTPIEVYEVEGIPVHVKRDDLCVTDVELPNTCKVRALVPLLLDYKQRGITRLAVYAPRHSRLGWAAAVLCKRLKLKLTYYYPVSVRDKNTPLLTVHFARQNGAKITALFTKELSESQFSVAKELALDNSEHMIPFGLASRIAVDAYMQEAATIPADLIEGGTVVGYRESGTTLLGVWMSVPNTTLVIGITAGPEEGWTVAPSPGKLRMSIVNSQTSQYNGCYTQVPFPSDPFCSAKAWDWLTKNIKRLKQPVLFYNMG